MSVILGTIALEPNRWTPFHEPRTDVIAALPAIRAAGFDELEVWQWHVSLRNLVAVRALRAKGDEVGVRFPYLGVYPAFHLEGADGREQERLHADMLDKAEVLGTRTLKIMLGWGLKGATATPAQFARTAERFGAWYHAAKARGLGMCVELHGNTLFDPVEVGEQFMRDHPDLDFGICFQPYEFGDNAKTLALVDRFAGRITHLHLQAPQPKDRGGRYDLLEGARLNYRQLLPALVRRQPRLTMTLEFVKDCIQDGPTFDLARVLANAQRDATFIKSILATLA